MTQKIAKPRSRLYVYGIPYAPPRHAWIVAHNPAAGVKHRYTVYYISLMDDAWPPRVIGRELPLAAARDVVKKDMEHWR
jgi:hypothetical protein